MLIRGTLVVALVFASSCVIRRGPGGENGGGGGSTSNGGGGGGGGAVSSSGGESNFAPIALTSGFTPDPAQLAGRSGGTSAASGMASGCNGWIASRPDHIMTLNSGFNFFRVFVHSTSDTTLVIQAPNGQYVCDDDSGDGNNPLVQMATWGPGQYRVWVGSYQQNEYSDYSIFFTELQSQM